MKRLYIVADEKIGGGFLAAQACHAARQFAADHPEVEREWFDTSNNIVILTSPDVGETANDVEARGFRVSRFHEPDIGDALTCIAVEPDAWKRLSSLPLAR